MKFTVSHFTFLFAVSSGVVASLLHHDSLLHTLVARSLDEGDVADTNLLAAKPGEMRNSDDSLEDEPEPANSNPNLTENSNAAIGNEENEDSNAVVDNNNLEDAEQPKSAIETNDIEDVEEPEEAIENEDVEESKAAIETNDIEDGEEPKEAIKNQDVEEPKEAIETEDVEESNETLENKDLEDVEKKNADIDNKDLEEHKDDIEKNLFENKAPVKEEDATNEDSDKEPTQQEYEVGLTNDEHRSDDSEATKTNEILGLDEEIGTPGIVVKADKTPETSELDAQSTKSPAENVSVEPMNSQASKSGFRVNAQPVASLSGTAHQGRISRMCILRASA
ncbi:hypothetical protein DSO57_1032604 [Entomophthora muscae]|uniref:Uncharacterized protein n=1 Tax=Entomophthora muscae TaxID=34485 RepID=A0ACC2UL02_9FUNG|nr:hypothetical protein DSO57_1032604 [Entomophthora muscae]